MIYVDDMQMPAIVGRIEAKWSHMFSDVSVQELKDFGDKIGMRHSWLQNTRGFIHYDVTNDKRAQAIKLGATPISWRDIQEHWTVSSGQYSFKHAASST
jgi:hypothetical protein